jgi:citrate synthase
MSEPKFIAASVAAARLGVKHATLYSYVSRGLVRTASLPGSPRERLYAATDIALLNKRKQLRRPSRAVAGALDFGLPVLETQISSIEGGVLRYKGVDATELARTASLEAVAKLIWELDGDLAEPSFRFRAPVKSEWVLRGANRSDPATDKAMRLLPLLLGWDESAYRKGKLPEICAGLVGAVAAASAGCSEIGPGSLHQALARQWHCPAASDPIRQALVLCADHELNASTFAVRVVASTGAGLTASVIAGLAALSGPRHGGMALRVKRLLDEIGTPGKARAVISARLRRGERIPGFDHPLYPDGDPRARMLLASCRNDPLLRAMLKAALDLAGLLPSLDIGLVAIEREFRLPRGSALSLFAIGRTVGWLAHALEQRVSPQLIRPRAKFVPPGLSRQVR